MRVPKRRGNLGQLGQAPLLTILVGFLFKPFLLVFLESIKRGLHFAQHVFDQIK
jgi:hypothetical protein